MLPIWYNVFNLNFNMIFRVCLRFSLFISNFFLAFLVKLRKSKQTEHIKEYGMSWWWRYELNTRRIHCLVAQIERIERKIERKQECLRAKRIAKCTHHKYSLNFVRNNIKPENTKTISTSSSSSMFFVVVVVSVLVWMRVFISFSLIHLQPDLEIHRFIYEFKCEP